MFGIGNGHKALVVAYHSINEYREDRIRVPNIVTPATFEAQIQSLASKTSIISLRTYLEHVREGKPLPDKSVIVTFDDGYKDNLTIAAPILQKYGVPATFYIATGTIGADEMKWEDRLSCLIRRSDVGRVSVSVLGGDVSYPLGSEAEKLKVVDTLVGILGHLRREERLQVLEEVGRQLGLVCQDRHGVMMTWKDVRQLAGLPGFSIGSHTVSHQHLTRIPPESLTFELTASKEKLEGEIGAPVEHFSYPYGDFDQAVVTAVQRSGYSSAVTIAYGQNNLSADLFRLKRVLVPNQRGQGFELGMLLRSSRLGEAMRKGYNMVTGLDRQAPVGQAKPRQEKG